MKGLIKGSIAAALLVMTSSLAIAADGKIVASDNAIMQHEDPAMPTRVIKEGTKINMHFGDTVILGILNDSYTAKALIDRLPITVRVNRYSHDFCGVMDDPLPYHEEDEHFGWLNGDIDFATDGNYFTILFEDEEKSEIYGSQINIGVIACPLKKISDLSGSYEVLIELAK
ncbi:cyclophilin-like fold protein [Succinatimonas hippei]|uniref:cyclophilin-like fold protein n=1 Tax=Succinatimonas hippei TaxID=626938 RepID=UPI0026F1D4E8|nr:cyclophilin-like fold protein [Succinatimonas hippei]